MSVHGAVLRSLLIVLSLLACAAGVAVWLAWGKTYTVTLTAAQLQEKLDQRFPIEKRYLMLVTLRLTEPKVRLEEGSDRIRFAVKATVECEGHSFEGTADLSGGIHYEPATGEFLIAGARVDALDVQKLPEKYHAIVLDIANLAAKQYLDRHPVYTLKPTDTKRSAAKLLLKSVRVEHSVLVIRLGLGS